MPSFDTVLEPNLVEVKNAVEQSNKEIGTRFDFKGSSAKVEQKDKELTLFADSDFQLEQVLQVPSQEVITRDNAMVTVDGVANRQGCLIPVADGIAIETQHARREAAEAPPSPSPPGGLRSWSAGVVARLLSHTCACINARARGRSPCEAPVEGRVRRRLTIE